MTTMTRRDWGTAALGGLVAAAGSAGAPAPAQPRDAYDYLHLDVFTDRPLTGNQLAVFLEPRGLDAATMQTFAKEEIYQRHDAQRRSVFVFSPERGADGATVYSRMLGLGGTEDAATGAASGPLGCYLVRHGLVPPASADRIVSAQGVKMGRPSRIHIRIGAEGSEITNVQVGGESVVVGSGVLRTTADRGARP